MPRWERGVGGASRLWARGGSLWPGSRSGSRRTRGRRRQPGRRLPRSREGLCLCTACAPVSAVSPRATLSRSKPSSAVAPEKTSRLPPREEDEKVSPVVEEFVREAAEKGVVGLRKEFDDLKCYVAPNSSANAFLANRAKNRYADVTCLDATRVILQKDKDTDSDYIHANWVRLQSYDRAYIATQGPLDNTIEDFWRMVYHNNVFCIVNLGRTVEQNKERCAQYWPETGHFYTGKDNTGYFVHNKKTTTGDRFAIYDIELLQEGCSDARFVSLIHFTDWPDRGAPLGRRVILRLLRAIHQHDKLASGNVAVHCSAGIGRYQSPPHDSFRTGTIIMIDWMIQALMHRGEKVEASKLLMELRRQRAHAVQTEGQWLFIYSSVLEYIRAKSKNQRMTEQIDKVLADIRSLDLQQ